LGNLVAEFVSTLAKRVGLPQQGLLLSSLTGRPAGLADHRLKNGKAARTDEAAAHIALGIQDHSGG